MEVNFSDILDDTPEASAENIVTKSIGQQGALAEISNLILTGKDKGNAETHVPS